MLDVGCEQLRILAPLAPIATVNALSVTVFSNA